MLQTADPRTRLVSCTEVRVYARWPPNQNAGEVGNGSARPAPRQAKLRTPSSATTSLRSTRQPPRRFTPSRPRYYKLCFSLLLGILLT